MYKYRIQPPGSITRAGRPILISLPNGARAPRDNIPGMQLVDMQVNLQATHPLSLFLTPLSFSVCAFVERRRINMSRQQVVWVCTGRHAAARGHDCIVMAGSPRKLHLNHRRHLTVPQPVTHRNRNQALERASDHGCSFNGFPGRSREAFQLKLCSKALLVSHDFS